MLKLLIGNRRFSSWSLRAWLLMKQLGIPFEDEVLRYGRDDWHATVRKVHAAGTVPVLVDGDFVVGDTLAIAETLHERFPEAGVWPKDAKLRARARSLCAEMHSSFGGLRSECSFDAFLQGTPRALSARAQADLARVDAILSSAKDGFLFGAFSAADAFFIPVALRALQYGLAVSPAAHAYIERAGALPSVREWRALAESERTWPALAAGGRPYHCAVICADDALRLARRWTGAWNERRLEAVLDMFAEDAVFVSPKAETIIGHARVEGKTALRAYWTAALAKIKELEFELETADWDPAASVITVIYQSSLAGKRARAAERWVVDAAGLIRHGEAYYGASA